jgi:hypothetical protein
MGEPAIIFVSLTAVHQWAGENRKFLSWAKLLEYTSQDKDHLTRTVVQSMGHEDLVLTTPELFSTDVRPKSITEMA